MMTKHVLVGAILVGLVRRVASVQVVFTKVQVGDRIRKVEDGVAEFWKWAENRAEQGKTNAESAKASGRTRSRGATDAQKEAGREKKDELEDALSDLNRSTNRLRRKFDPTDKWMETRPRWKTCWTTGARSTRSWCAASTARRRSAIGACYGRRSTIWHGATT